jgi:hypothetical protein
MTEGTPVNSKERIKRPHLDRTQPIRSWSTLFAAPGASRAPSTPPAGSVRAKAEASLSDVVSHSVDLGYRVIDEYIRQGQKAAQRFTDRSYAPDTITGDAQELASRMAQYASDFTALWIEFMQVTMGNAGRWPMPPFDGFGVASQPKGQAAPAAPAPAAAGAADVPRVKIAVASPSPTEVLVDLRPDATARRFVVHSLRAVGPDKPPISGVVLESTGGEEPLTLRIRVPAGQPAGTYSGLIVDADTSRLLGSVSLSITPD